MSREELEYLDETRTLATFKPGETILKQGTPVDSVLSFVSGLAKAYIEIKPNHNFIIQLYKNQDFISMPGVYYQQINHFTISAVEKSNVCYIELNRFFEVLKNNQDFNTAYLEHINRMHVQLLERLINLNRKQSRGKIADVVLYLSNQIFKSDKFNIPFSNSEIAQLAGISKEGTFKIIKELTNSGIIVLTNNTLEILDLHKLQLISEKG